MRKREKKTPFFRRYRSSRRPSTPLGSQIRNHAYGMGFVVLASLTFIVCLYVVVAAVRLVASLI